MLSAISFELWALALVLWVGAGLLFRYYRPAARARNACRAQRDRQVRAFSRSLSGLSDVVSAIQKAAPHEQAASPVPPGGRRRPRVRWPGHPTPR